MTECDRYLSALFGDAEGHVELRWPIENGMGRAFFGASQLSSAAAYIAHRARDVYIGVLPRRRQASTREDLVSHASVLWVDCDTPAATRKLDQLDQGPSILVASGTGENRHAYWLLSEPLSIDLIEAANRALAERLGADLASSDAARILRPPSLNYKHDPPAPVELLGCDPALRYRVEDFDLHLQPVDHSNNRLAPPEHSDDQLLNIAPAAYVEQLTGLRVSRSGKVACPFHKDDTPSLQVYVDSERGWYCYGCRRGGSIYDFAAYLWKIEPRGAGFLELRQRLRDIVRA